MIEIGVCAIAGFEETRQFWFDMRLCVHSWQFATYNTVGNMIAIYLEYHLPFFVKYGVIMTWYQTDFFQKTKGQAIIHHQHTITDVFAVFLHSNRMFSGKARVADPCNLHTFASLFSITAPLLMAVDLSLACSASTKYKPLRSFYTPTVFEIKAERASTL